MNGEMCPDCDGSGYTCKGACFGKPPQDGSTMDDKDEAWEHAGLQCMLKIRRTPGQGPFNGYVRVPASHPCAGRHASDVSVKVHGGLTYDRTDGDGSTWFGWDDRHSRCERPARDETNRLADQLAAMISALPEGSEAPTPDPSPLEAATLQGLLLPQPPDGRRWAVVDCDDGVRLLQVEAT